MNDEMELKKYIKSSLKRGMGIWETWNPGNFNYLYIDNQWIYEEDSSFELNDYNLKFHLTNFKRGYSITLTFDLENIFKIIGSDETYRFDLFCVGMDTIGNKSKRTKVFKVEYSNFQNYYYENFKEELKDKELNYFITGCTNYIFEIISLGEPTISFDTFEAKEEEEANKDNFFEEDNDDNIGELYKFDEIMLPFDKYKLESFNLGVDYYTFVLYGEKTEKKYKITFYYNNVHSVMINRRKCFKGKDVEYISNDRGVRMFYEVEDFEFFEWYKQHALWDIGADDLRHIRFNGCGNFVIDFIFDCCKIGVMEI